MKLFLQVVSPGRPATVDFRAMVPGRKTRNGTIPGRKARNGWFNMFNSLLSQFARPVMGRSQAERPVMGGLVFLIRYYPRSQDP